MQGSLLLPIPSWPTLMGPWGRLRQQVPQEPALPSCLPSVSPPHCTSTPIIPLSHSKYLKQVGNSVVTPQVHMTDRDRACLGSRWPGSNVYKLTTWSAQVPFLETLNSHQLQLSLYIGTSIPPLHDLCP